MNNENKNTIFVFILYPLKNPPKYKIVVSITAETNIAQAFHLSSLGCPCFATTMPKLNTIKAIHIICQIPILTPPTYRSNFYRIPNLEVVI